jgi:hypothetical protein
MWRLGLIIGGTLILTAFLWVTFYFWGFSRPIYKYENAFLPESKIFVRSNSIQQDLMPGDGVFIEIGLERDTLYCNGIVCSELLSQITNQKVLIRLNINKVDIHSQFLSVFEGLKARKDIGFVSRFPTVVSSVKERVPGWSYGASEVEQSKLKIFEGLGLIHVPELKCDFWVTSSRGKQEPFSAPNILKELKRRGKAILFELGQNQSEAELALGLGADAVIVESYLRSGLKSNL